MLSVSEDEVDRGRSLAEVDRACLPVLRTGIGGRRFAGPETIGTEELDR
jgi:hypothetical protein